MVFLQNIVDSDDVNVTHTHTHTKSLILIQKVKMRLSAGDDFTGMSGVTIECTNPQSVIK